MYDEENPDRIIGFSYDGKVGSKTTADLFNFMANDAEAEYSIGFYNVSDGSKGTSDGNKAKNSYWLNVNQSNADIYEQIARIAHEATHLYTLKQGYNDAVEKDIYWRQDINERQKYTSDIVKGYQEMTAMLVENCVRKELNASYGKNGAQVVAPRLLSDGYGSMLDSTAKMKDAVSGYGFGFWPWMPCSYEGTSEQRASDFYGMYQFAFENTTLNMTLGIIPDIWRNAN